MKLKKILITGSEGFIGKNLSTFLKYFETVIYRNVFNLLNFFYLLGAWKKQTVRWFQIEGKPLVTDVASSHWWKSTPDGRRRGSNGLWLWGFSFGLFRLSSLRCDSKGIGSYPWETSYGIGLMLFVFLLPNLKDHNGSLFLSRTKSIWGILYRESFYPNLLC